MSLSLRPPRPALLTTVLCLGFVLACSQGDDSSSSQPTPNEAPAPDAPAPAPAEAPATKAPESPKTYLAAVVATSGDGRAMFDGEPTTGWKPTGDPRGEGVLVRFEKPTQVESIRFEACKGAGAFTLTPFYNGTEGDLMDVPAGSSGGGGDVERAVRSAFFRVDAGNACIAEMEVFDGEAVLPLAPPRQVTGKVSASSTLAPENAYHSAYVFDSRTDFGWVEGSAGLGVGETYTIELDAPFALKKLEIWNGYQRSQDHFDKNARASKLAISVGGAREEVAVDPEVFGPQSLPFAGGVEGKTIALEILEAHAGTRYKDLVISEIRLWDEQGPVRVAVKGTAERASALKGKVAGTAVAPLVDKLWMGACTEVGERTLKLRSDHSFVWYEPSEMSLEIFDGAWVPKGPHDGGDRIQLYGRRHLSEESWEPYSSENGMKESTKIGGGKPVLYAVDGMDAADFTKHADAVRSVFGRDCDYDQAELAKKGAVVIRDKSITDILVPKP